MSILIFVLVSTFVLLFVLWLYPRHHDKKHTSAAACEARIQAIPTAIAIDCSLCDVLRENCSKLHTEQNDKCSQAIERINSESEKQKNDVEKVQAILDNALQLGTKYEIALQNQLVNNDWLAATEKSVENGDIYVMTSKFELELVEPMLDALIDNINQGVNYRYIIPKSQKGKFEKMVSEIIQDDRFDKTTKNKDVNDFLIASPIPDEQIMPTIAYYPLPKHESEVIIKLASDRNSARDGKAYSAYKVPKSHRDENDEYIEHAPFLKNLTLLFENVPEGERACPTIAEVEKKARPPQKKKK